MSVSSAKSSMSVSYCGSEMPLEEALDDIFKKLQQHLNDSHCAVRSMSMLEEQSMDEDSDWKEATKYDNIIQDDVDGMIALFRDLKSISKQVLGKAPNPDMKAWYTHNQSQRKEEHRLEKEREKLAKIEEKDN
jgi:hypothetical protein